MSAHYIFTKVVKATLLSADLPHLLVRIDDVDESWFQTGTANQESIDVFLLGKLAAVLLANTSTVDDPGVLGRLGADGLRQPITDGGMDFLCLF